MQRAMIVAPAAAAGRVVRSRAVSAAAPRPAAAANASALSQRSLVTSSALLKTSVRSRAASNRAGPVRCVAQAAAAAPSGSGCVPDPVGPASVGAMRGVTHVWDKKQCPHARRNPLASVFAKYPKLETAMYFFFWSAPRLCTQPCI